jgi:hypothetical protein
MVGWLVGPEWWLEAPEQMLVGVPEQLAEWAHLPQVLVLVRERELEPK